MITAIAPAICAWSDLEVNGQNPLSIKAILPVRSLDGALQPALGLPVPSSTNSASPVQLPVRIAPQPLDVLKE